MSAQNGLIDGDKRIQAINKQLAELAKTLEGSAYTPLRGDPNYVTPNQRVRIPQFSDARNNLLAFKTALETERATITAQLSAKAAAYTPPPGPATAIIKQEIKLATKYGAKPATETKTVVTQPPATEPVAPTPIGQRAEEARFERIRQRGGVGSTGGQGAAGTGAAATGAAATGAAAAAEQPETVTAEGILDELAARFPAYQDWTLEQATGYFGADLIKVLTDTANGVYGTGANKNKEAIARAIEGTTYWRTTVSSIRNWDALAKPDQDRRVVDQKRLLAQTFGELQLDDATLTDLATTIQRTGLSELGAKQLVYGAAFARPRSEFGPQPAKLALESAAADEIRKIARAYGYMPSDIDNQIQAILTGKPYAATGTVLTTDSFRQKAQKAAQGSFRHLKDQFDAGLTLDDVFGNYQAIASRVLEIDP